ncbi:MAG: endonuclease/exonuclease/phosphatase family protein [Winogradskyella sp.]|uniref:endonuclease/exonuclease/phosphatase family protein n=1 Tax=Winogradskyella sp. TaxID=1883156 RepID=UPI0017A350DF|nr:endonuclease/exonuclease/phosphatase family protein [Winogradskyella sp.]MBT8245512.1 endonuclease/exonuclease/phosphatase family protein [Winogradskyella sp.]NNK23897.1 endonuclease/exonuclease/phosphatase family protein [Winogradskyella sp.]
MKGLKFFDRLIFFVNSLAAFLLLFAYILPYIPPKSFSLLAVLSLAVPVLIFLNILFFLYWLLNIKKQLLLSLIVLLLGFNYITSIYKFTGSKIAEDTDNFSVMNYNIRLFNLFDWLSSSTIDSEILKFVKSENPSIICFQEYHKNEAFALKGYQKFENVSDGKVKSGQAIFSKFPIVNKGSISFPNTSNNAIFIDIVKQKDTIRVYNVHLQSIKVSPKVSDLQKEGSEQLTKRIGDVFKIQQSQAEQVLAHMSKCPYKVIISGDFNNTAYSYVYDKIKGDLQDAFKVAGNGFGKTYDFNKLPLRIDFILVDKDFTVNGFKNYDVELSDHYPIKTILK